MYLFPQADVRGLLFSHKLGNLKHKSVLTVLVAEMSKTKLSAGLAFFKGSAGHSFTYFF